MGLTPVVAGDQVQRPADVGLLLGEPAPERQYAVAVVHAVGDDRRVRLHRAELLPHRRMRAGKFRVQHDGERNIQFLEQPADARDAPVDRVLTESLVHEVRVAGHHVRAEDRALAEAELLDEQREADRDLLAAGPGGDMDRVAREAGDPVDSVLRQGSRKEGERRAAAPVRRRSRRPGLPRHVRRRCSWFMAGPPSSWRRARA